MTEYREPRHLRVAARDRSELGLQVLQTSRHLAPVRAATGPNRGPSRSQRLGQSCCPGNLSDRKHGPPGSPGIIRTGRCKQAPRLVGAIERQERRSQPHPGSFIAIRRSRDPQQRDLPPSVKVATRGAGSRLGQELVAHRYKT